MVVGGAEPTTRSSKEAASWWDPLGHLRESKRGHGGVLGLGECPFRPCREGRLSHQEAQPHPTWLLTLTPSGPHAGPAQTRSCVLDRPDA